MAKTLSSSPFPQLKRVKQLTDFYCGPAVLEMLLGFCGIETSQDEIIQTAQVERKIKEHGMTVDDMALAVQKLVSQLSFWFKRYSLLSELSQLVNVYKYPVGVEWQGIFDPEGNHDEPTTSSDDDPGHYSIVVHLNMHDNEIILTDPYELYAGKDRKFTVLEFERRWWDINEVVDPKTKKHRQIDDYHMMFIITPSNVTFPEKLEMIRG